jgi:cyanophycin synthetase
LSKPSLRKIVFHRRKNREAKDIAATRTRSERAAIVEAAEKRGIPWTRENDYSLVQFGYGKNLRFVQAAMTDRTGIAA